MSRPSMVHIVLTGRLAEDVKTEVLLALLSVGVVTGISFARLEGVWLYAVPAAVAVYSAIRIGLVARRNRNRVRAGT